MDAKITVAEMQQRGKTSCRNCKGYTCVGGSGGLSLCVLQQWGVRRVIMAIADKIQIGLSLSLSLFLLFIIW